MPRLGVRFKCLTILLTSYINSWLNVRSVTCEAIATIQEISDLVFVTHASFARSDRYCE